MEIDFRKPARIEDVLEVVTENEEIKGASITVRQRVLRGEEELISALVQVAFVSGGRARPIPKALRTAMQADKDAAGGSRT
jgi:acyl-CoA thioester hydrolase